MKRLIVYIIEVILCYLIQSAMFHYIALVGVMPNLLLILVVSTAYMRGKLPGMTLGLCCGLLVDLMSGSSVVGLCALIYMLIGYVIGLSNRFYTNDDYTLPIILIAVSDFFYGFFYYIFEFLLRGRLNFPYYFSRLILPEIIYTVAVSVFLYKLLHMINNRLEKSPDEEG